MDAVDDTPEHEDHSANSELQTSEEGWVTSPEDASRLNEAGCSPAGETDSPANPANSTDTSDQLNVSSTTMSFKDKFLTRFGENAESLIARIREDRPKEYIKLVYKAWKRTPPPQDRDATGRRRYIICRPPIGYDGEVPQTREELDDLIRSNQETPSSGQRWFDSLLVADFDREGDQVMEWLKDNEPVFYLNTGMKLMIDEPAPEKNTKKNGSQDSRSYLDKRRVIYFGPKTETEEQWEKETVEQQRRLVEAARNDPLPETTGM